MTQIKAMVMWWTTCRKTPNIHRFEIYRKAPRIVVPVWKQLIADENGVTDPGIIEPNKGKCSGNLRNTPEFTKPVSTVEAIKFVGITIAGR
jgi:hypothetical protein